MVPPLVPDYCVLKALPLRRKAQAELLLGRPNSDGEPSTTWSATGECVLIKVSHLPETIKSKAAWGPKPPTELMGATLADLALCGAPCCMQAVSLESASQRAAADTEVTALLLASASRGRVPEPSHIIPLLDARHDAHAQRLYLVSEEVT
jgi:hypothetical protein